MAKKQRGKTSSSSKTEDSEKRTESFSLTLDSADHETGAGHGQKRKGAAKEKRRKRQELFQEQKKRKLLSADVLEEIDSAPSKKQKQSVDEGQEEGEEDGKKKKKKRSGKLADARNLKGKYTVTTTKERTLTSLQQQMALEFIQSRLYGPGTCRTTSYVRGLKASSLATSYFPEKNPGGVTYFFIGKLTDF
ncbi:nucleolar protein 7-like [Archocentrus centrarchus]|uniref:nucleolar protein 7-like n=1 Tax=Archocentrus centrarchus TaxID=63155 RepID=UPI0011EA35E4|nr:nucleolar protein 7-like [Archocentrus centrarchus]